MFRDFLLKQFDELRLQERVHIFDVEADDSLQRGMRGKYTSKRLHLERIHRKNDVGPFEHARVDAHPGILFSAGGPYIEIRPLGEDAFGGGAAMTIEATDKEDPFGRRRMGHGEFRVILTASPQAVINPNQL